MVIFLVSFVVNDVEEEFNIDVLRLCRELRFFKKKFEDLENI